MARDLSEALSFSLGLSFRCGSGDRMWSPTVSEDGKTSPYMEPDSQVTTVYSGFTQDPVTDVFLSFEFTPTEMLSGLICADFSCCERVSPLRRVEKYIFKLLTSSELRERPNVGCSFSIDVFVTSKSLRSQLMSTQDNAELTHYVVT